MQININGSLDKYRFLITEAKKNGQKKGREEAWDLARRIIDSTEDCYDMSEITKIFGTTLGAFNMPSDEAIEKDRTYQKEKKDLHVGDEVKFRSSDMLWLCGYVIKISSYESVTVLTKDGTTHVLRISDLAKTGSFNEDLVKALAAFDDMDGEK